jgi:flagellar biosynthetic protein FliQ
VTEAQATHLATQALVLGIELAGPVLAVSLAVGLLVSLFQAVTQLQEFTLSFVPKAAAVALVLVLSGHWMLSQFLGFVHSSFAEVPRLVGGG